MIYDLFLELEQSNNEQMYATCPFHSDSTPSLTVNSDTEEWFCFACDEGGGPVQFIMKYYNVGDKVANYLVREYNKKSKIVLPTTQYINKCVENLHKRESQLKMLMNFGISLEVINRFKLGWEDQRITIPISSNNGHIINVRKYLPPDKRVNDKAGKTINITGLAEERFFPYTAFELDEIWIVEGEKDCLVAISQGLNAVTSTGGSNIPLKEFNLFEDKIVNIMVDTDEAGLRLAKNYKRFLVNVAKQINTYTLPCKDFTDYWMEYGKVDLEQYKKEEVIESVSNLISVGGEADNNLEVLSLSESESIKHEDKWFKLESMSILGTDPITYKIPIELQVECGNATCNRPCSVAAMGGKGKVAVDERSLIEFLESHDNAQANLLRKMYQCKSVISLQSKTVNAQRIVFQEAASFIDGLDEATFESRVGIFLYEGSNRLTPTLRYDFEAKVLTDPRNQRIYYLIRRAEQVDRALDVDLTDTSFLDYFRERAESSNSIFDLLNEYYEEWLPILGIEGRVDLFGTILLTYLSVTEIPWGGAYFKGWLDTMVIGDTRTGKSQMAQRFVKHLGLGGYINGENARATGVIGGVNKLGNNWMITWGATPMNDRGLLVIDEASGLSIDTIKEFSSTRSSGAVTINKIVKGEAKARTRLLWLSNPRDGRNLADFFYKGFDAFKQFIPVAEDQARYDIVISAAREDVGGIGYRSEITSPNYSIYRQLISLAWKLERSDISIVPQVAEYIVKKAAELSSEYSGGPLVMASSVYEKICRVSCAVAVLTGSYYSNKLQVSTRDVDYAIEFLSTTYNKKSFGYASYLKNRKITEEEIEKNTAYIRAMTVTHPGLEILLESNNFRNNQVQEMLGLDRMEAGKLISELCKKRLIRLRGSGSYAPLPLLIDIIRKMEEENV